jgi:hypothetical protein
MFPQKKKIEMDLTKGHYEFGKQYSRRKMRLSCLFHCTVLITCARPAPQSNGFCFDMRVSSAELLNSSSIFRVGCLASLLMTATYSTRVQHTQIVLALSLLQCTYSNVPVLYNTSKYSSSLLYNLFITRVRTHTL